MLVSRGSRTRWLWVVGLLVITGCSTAPAAMTATATPTAAPTTPVPPATPTAAPTTPAPPATPTAASTWWRPEPGLSWQWQLTGPLQLDLPVQVWDLDGEETPARVVEQLHAQGKRVICYISVGSYEEWRSDADQFPPEVLGNPYEGWPGERWLDIRRLDLLGPIMQARLDMCAAKGFDAVEPDNLMAYTEDTGFPLTLKDNLAYALWLAREAHARGLAIGLKNGAEMVPYLVEHYDFAIVEEAFLYDFAAAFTPFIVQGKAVFAAEYTDTEVDWPQACRQAQALGFSLILKQRDLDAWVTFCP